MKNKLLLSSFFLIFILFVNKSSAQDIIRTKKDTIQAKVTEVGIDEIRYHMFTYPDGPVIVILKRDVISITYENGIKEFYAPDPYEVNADLTVRKKTHSIKLDMLALARNNLTFSYEQMLKVGTNLDIKAGVIGIGTNNNNDNVSGVLLKAGIKFLTSSQYVQRGLKYYHGLKGWYIKPELIFNSYRKTDQSNNYYYPYTYAAVREDHTNFGLDIVFGYQHVLGNIMTLEYYGGLGYIHNFDGKKSNNTVYYNDTFGDGYGYTALGSTYNSNTPLIISGGITIGFFSDDFVIRMRMI